MQKNRVVFSTIVNFLFFLPHLVWMFIFFISFLFGNFSVILDTFITAFFYIFILVLHVVAEIPIVWMMLNFIKKKYISTTLTVLSIIGTFLGCLFSILSVYLFAESYYYYQLAYFTPVYVIMALLMISAIVLNIMGAVNNPRPENNYYNPY